ncbi:Imm7 family immunity protein [Streptomyces sp. NPDC048255]|uniref:Imm7 family immunity protein n=1 Tax=Streptomyces sp. NPDC048255 TaxID=3154713 RepID=UPI0033FC1EE0
MRVLRLDPGPYGLLHLRDDEDRAHGNEVRVLRPVRGVRDRVRRTVAVTVHPGP